MKRPLIMFTAAFALAALLQIKADIFSFCWNYLPIVSVAVFLICVLCCVERFRVVGILLVGAICGTGFAVAYDIWIVAPVQSLSGVTTTVTATVAELPEIYDDSQRVLLRCDRGELPIQCPGNTFRSLVYLPLTEETLQPGDRVTAAVSFYVPSISDGFQREQYYRANSVYLLGSYQKNDDDSPTLFSVKPCAKTPLRYLPLLLRQRLTKGLHHTFDTRTAGFLQALLLGDKDGLSERDARNLKIAGLSHVIAVSGMHVGFLIGLFFLLFGRKYGAVLSILALVVFVPMAGASASVIRAAIMYLMAAVAFLIGRESDSLNALCVALLILLIRNPFTIESVSLQLSFASSLGLILFGVKLQRAMMRPLLEKPLQPLFRTFTGILSCSLCSLLFTAPILFYTFGYVSWLSPLSNLLVLGIIGIVFVLGFLAAICAIVLPAVATVIGVVLTPLVHYVLWIADGVASLHFGLVFADHAYVIVALCLLYAAILSAILFLHRNKKKLARYALLLASGIVLATASVGAVNSASEISVANFPCGGGQAILVADAEELTLIDCAASGHRNAADLTQEYMEYRGFAEIETLILTSVDKTHARDVPQLLRETPVHAVLLPPNCRDSDLLAEIQKAAQTQGIPVTIWTQTTETPFPSSDSISIIGGIDRKLAVRIVGREGDILVLHSLTQKMLDKLLSQQPLSAESIVLSNANIEEETLLRQALAVLQPKTLYIASGYGDPPNTLDDIPVRSTNNEGQIITYLHSKAKGG